MINMYFFFSVSGCEIGGEEEPQVSEPIAFRFFDRQPQFRYYPLIDSI